MGNSIADIFQEGREEGLREGHKEGHKEGLAEAVGKLVSDGSLAPDKIAALFDMTVDQVEECAARQGRTAQGA